MKKQSKGKKRIVLSGVAVLTTLALLAGGTMAWFTDTERIGADFQAGVLDIEVSTSTDGPITQDMTFTNLRPMELESFEAELNGTDFEGKAADEIVNPNTDGFDPLPVYFHPVTVTNVGSLPAQVRFTMEDAGPCNGTIANLVDNGFGGVKPGDPAQARLRGQVQPQGRAEGLCLRKCGRRLAARTGRKPERRELRRL